MKISELIKKTGVSKETIHYYIREGVLPQPMKTGKNTSDYDEGFVEKIRTVKALQENFYLPLSTIKEILREYRDEPPEKQTYLGFMSEHFRPFDLLFDRKIYGKKAFMEETGMAKKWVESLQEWKILSRVREDETEVFSGDDAVIARLLVSMDELGFGPGDGYDPALLAEYAALFSKLIEEGGRRYIEQRFGKVPQEEFILKVTQYSELLALFGYRLFRKMAKESLREFGKKAPAKP